MAEPRLIVLRIMPEETPVPHYCPVPIPFILPWPHHKLIPLTDVSC